MKDTPETLICSYCGKPFIPTGNMKKYCSHYCVRKAKCKVKARPLPKTLKQLMLKHSLAEIGRMYGVSGNTIRKWCKAYSSPSKSSEIQRISQSDWDNI